MCHLLCNTAPAPAAPAPSEESIQMLTDMGKTQVIFIETHLLP